MKDKKPIYGPMNDVIFKNIFGREGNEKITKSFLESVIGEEIETINVDYKQEIPKASVYDKKMETDVFAKDNNLTKYIIEMQRRAYDYLTDRFMGYLARTYVANIKVKQKYETLTRTVMVIIMKSNFKTLEDVDKYHTVWNMREQDFPDKVLSNKLEVHILELSKYKKYKQKTGKVDAWLEFFINPYGEEVLKMARTYEELRAAVDQLILLEADEEVSNLAWEEAFTRWDNECRLAEEKAERKG